MEKRKQIYEGKAKKVFATDDDHFLIVEYKDDATAFNGLKKGTIAGKGIINNKMSNIFMEMLLNRGIYNGVRVMKESSVEKLKTRICENWGLGVNVRDDTTPLPENSYGWSGAYGTHFWVDEENQITALMLKNHRALTDNFWGESIHKFENSVMNSFEL